MIVGLEIVVSATIEIVNPGMDILDLFPNIEIDYLTFQPCCIAEKAHFEIGLVSERDRRHWKPENINRVHAKVCLDLSEYFTYQSPDYQHSACPPVVTLPQHIREGTSRPDTPDSQAELSDPEANQASAPPSIGDYYADLNESDLESAKNIQLCQCATCEYQQDLEIEPDTFFSGISL